MGCGASSTLPRETSPVTTHTLTRIDSDCWMWYPPPQRPELEDFSSGSVSTYSSRSTCYEQASSYWCSDDTGRSTPVSTISPVSTATSPAHTPATSLPTPVSCTSTHEYPPRTPQSTPTYTNRTYSLLSTPNFHSPSSHPRNDLTLDPNLICTPRFTNAGQCSTKMDTDCASRFAGDRTPTPVHCLTLDPSLFSNHLSPFAEAAWRSGPKMDTEGASRFPSTTDESLSPSFASPVSTSKKRYPLTLPRV